MPLHPKTVKLSKDIYLSTLELFTSIEAEIEKTCAGFEILLGPPYQQAPIMFIGFQPGPGDYVSLDALERRRNWPPTCDYVNAEWVLAQRLRDIFGDQLLARSVGTNAIFFQADTVAEYGKLKAKLRRTIERHCLPLVEKLVKAIEPKIVVFIGLQSMRLFGETSVWKKSGAKRTLLERGCIAGREAFSVLHLSGAWISSQDTTDITSALRNLCRDRGVEL
jgi:hypothetical protein